MTESPPIMLITGASRGIGRATAILAAKHGYSVGINYQSNTVAASEVVAKCRDLGASTCLIQADVANPHDIDRMFQQLDNELGELDVLVNNAGIVAKSSRLSEMSSERIERIMQTNVVGTLLCAKQAVLRMSTANGGKGGSIVNVSSRAAVLGSAREYVDYAASKGAVDTFTVGLANEVADQGIRVNAVRPGLIDTDIHASGGKPDRVESLRHSIPMQRGGTADEVANAIVWLVSEAASYTTGTCLDISGGR